MEKAKTHKPPLLCRIKRELFGPSPSCTLLRCTLGLWNECRWCAGCQANVRETYLQRIQEGIQKGIHEGRRAGIVLCDELEGLRIAAAKASEAFTNMANSLKELTHCETTKLERCPNRRVVHLAKYGRKRRTRKKNLHRAVRIVGKEDTDE